MKRIIRIVIIILYCLVLSGCSLCSKKNNKKLKSPKVQVIGDYILWEDVEEAESYDIYKNDELYANINITQFKVGMVSSSTKFNVVAVNNNSERNSDKSNSCMVMKNCEFNSSESLIISLCDNEQYTIPSNILYVEITGTASSSSIIVENRYQTLIIKLSNVNLTSPEGLDCISVKGGSRNLSTMKFETIFQIEGSNTLIGSDYMTKPNKPNKNTEVKGTNGGNGSSGIVLPDIKLTGYGSLFIDAGNGGPGGDGSDSADWENKIPGEGGNGGNGGDAICCNNFYLVMDINGSVSCYPGDGGIKGSHGINGSALTGPWIMHKLDSMNGLNGQDGLSIRGESKVVAGVLIE